MHRCRYNPKGKVGNGITYFIYMQHEYSHISLYYTIFKDSPKLITLEAIVSNFVLSSASRAFLFECSTRDHVGLMYKDLYAFIGTCKCLPRSVDRYHKARTLIVTAY